MTHNTQFHLTAYTPFSHNHIIALLSSNDAAYDFHIHDTSELYSRFRVVTDMETLRIIRDQIEQNDGTSISIEYGSE